MNFKRIMLVFILLAILTMGAVSASDNSDISDNVVSAEDGVDVLADDVDDEEDFREYADGSGTVKPNIEVFWPNEIQAWEDVEVSFKVPEDMNSSVALFINNERVDDGQIASNDVSYDVFIDELGNYTLKFKFFGDDKYAPTIKQKSYRVTEFYFDVELEDENLTYGDDTEVSIDLPADATGFVTVAGVKYQIGEETYLTIPLKNLNLGTNQILVSYSGDKHYSSKSKTLTVNVKAEIKYSIAPAFDNVTYSLRLPKDAAGSLEVTVDGKTLSSKLTNGYAQIKVNDLTLGGHDFNARYTGDDYTGLDTGNVHFEVTPNITVESFKRTKDDNTLKINLPKGETGKLNVVIYRSIQGERVDVLNKTVDVSDGDSFSFSRFTYGFYIWDIKYTSNSGYFYSTIANGYVRDDFKMDVTAPAKVLSDDENITIAFTYLDVETGSISLYVDGELYDEIACEQVPTEFVIDDCLEVGNHKVEVKYSGNERYMPLEKSFVIESTNVFFNIPDEIVIGSDDEISIETVKDATGNLAVYVEGSLFQRKAIKNGFASVNMSSLQFKTYSVRVVYENGNYPSMARNAVLKVSYTFKMTNDTAAYADDSLYFINVPDGLSADKLVVKVDNVACPVVVSKGKVGVDLSGLDIGSHVITVSHPGEGSFYPLSVEKTIEVLGVIETPSQITFGEDKSISLTLPKNPEGRLVLYEYDKIYHYYVPVSSFGFVLNGDKAVAEIPMSYFSLGKHKIKLSYSGSDYNVSTVVKEISIDLDISFSKYVQYGKKSTVTVNLPGAQDSMDVYIDDEYVDVVDFVNGVAKIVLSDLDVGAHYLKLEYDGEYSFTYDEAMILVYPSISVPSTVIDGSPAIIVNSGDEPTGSIIVYDNGKRVKEVDLYGGKEKISLSSLSAGTHKISLVYDSWDEMRYALNYTVKVKKASIIANNMVMYHLDGSQFKVQVKDYKGKAVKKGQTVTLYINNKKVATAKTDDKGFAAFNFKYAPKDYNVKVVYKATSVTKKITVKKILTLSKVPVKKSKKLVLTASIKKVKGINVNDQKITFKFGKNTLTAKTGKNGVASVTVPDKLLKALKVGNTITYLAKYAGETQKITVKIEK